MRHKDIIFFFFFFFGYTNPFVVQALPVPLVGLDFSDHSDLIDYHSRIVSPTYGDTVYLELEPMTGML